MLGFTGKCYGATAFPQGNSVLMEKQEVTVKEVVKVSHRYIFYTRFQYFLFIALSYCLMNSVTISTFQYCFITN